MTSRRRIPLLCFLIAAPGLALAQATVKPDGQFRYSLGAGASYSSGNSDASSINLSGDGVRATDMTKWTFGGKALWSRSEGTTTAENATLGTQYNSDFTPLWFDFAKGDLLRDKLANLSLRSSVYGGVGRHVIRENDLTFDVSAGVGYTQDRYVDPAVVQDELRNSYGRAEVLLAEESAHKFTPTTQFHQKLSVYPALSKGGGYRGIFDSGLSVAMTNTLSLTAGLNYRYDSDPGVGLKRGDTLFVTGISVKID